MIIIIILRKAIDRVDRDAMWCCLGHLWNKWSVVERGAKFVWKE